MKQTETDFIHYYSKYIERFVRYALFYVNDRQTAEDIAHDALLNFWENKENLPDDTNIFGYILLSIKNKCLNHLKHLQAKDEYIKKSLMLHDWEITARIQTLEDESYSAIFSEDIINISKKAMQELPKQMRNIFEMNLFGHKSRKEIAELLGVSLQKIDYHINKAIDHLQKKLKDYITFLF